MKKFFSLFAAMMLMVGSMSAATIYCKMDKAWWTADGAAVGIYTWDDLGTPKAAWPGERLTPVEGQEGVWSFDLDLETYHMCIFTRVNGEGEIADWGAKTGDLTIPADKDLFTITSETPVWGDPGCTGEWSVYGEDPVEDEWTEIKFAEAVDKDALPADASVVVDGFSLQITDPDNKMAIDANDCRFGTPEAFTDYTHRLKTGGKTNETVTKNFITLTAPEAGQLRIAVRTGSNGDETRTLVIKQGENELYNKVVKEADKTVVEEISYYPFIIVDVAAGPVVLSYPVNGINFYAFAFKAAPAPADPTVAVAGTMSEWAEIPFKLSEDKKKATLFNDNIKAGTYEFKMVINGEWRSNGYKFHRDFPGCAGITGNVSENMIVELDVEGAYTFEWYFENDSLAIHFPEKPAESPIVETYFATGDGWAPDTESSAIWDAEAQKVTVNIALDKVAQWQAQVKYQALASEPGKFYNFSVKMKANNAVNGVTVKWDDNTGLVMENIDLEAGTEFVVKKENIQSNAAGNGILVFDFGFAKAGDVIEIYDVVVEEAAAPVVELEDGFYVIGLNGWTIFDLTAADKFEANPEAEGEFTLTTTLAANSEFKVVAVAENALGAWYPAEAGNYVVDMAHAGEAKPIYFRPNYDGGEGWHAGCIFVPENVVPVNPIDHTYFATGSNWDADTESSAVWDPETGKITVTLALPKEAAWQGQVFINTVKAEVGKCYNFSVKMKSNKDLSGATIKWQENNNDPIMVSEINTISLKADEEFVYTKQQIAGQEGNGQLVYDFGFAEAGTVIEIYDLVIAETACPEPEPVNYYLVGTMTEWTVIEEDQYHFAANGEVEGEFKLATTLTEGQGIKVVGVQGEAQTWYPEGMGNEYVVDAAHAGSVTIYFRPAGNEEWAAFGGFIYVDAASGIDEILFEGKAVKVLREGKLIIMKGDHEYTPMGQIVK